MERLLKVLGEQYSELVVVFGLTLLIYFLIRLNEKAKEWEHKEAVEAFTFLTIVLSSIGLFAIVGLLVFRILKKVIFE